MNGFLGRNRRLARAALLVAALAALSVTFPASSNAGSARDVKTETVRYGPFLGHPGSHHHEPGEGGGEIQPDVRRPCKNCYLTAMSADLTYGDGGSANYDTEAMLHHVVLLNRSRQDFTCAGWPERFFASGNERTPFVLPAGYGYRVKPEDRWALAAHVVSTGHSHQVLYVKVTFTYRKAPAPLEGVRPAWLDINNCSNSQYSIPEGRSATNRDFVVSPGLDGRLLAMGGHIHDDGVKIKATNRTRGETLCTSVAGYGKKRAYKGHIESMTGCLGDPLARVRAGDVVRLRSIYNSRKPRDDVMGIMVGYVDPTDPP